MTGAEPSLADVEAFLQQRYGAVRHVGLLHGGAWSTAYAFDVDAGRFVARFGRYIEDYEKDRMASAWSQPGLPIPEVVAIGEAFDGFFAVSRRVDGDKFDALPPERLAVALESLVESLVVLEQVDLGGSGYGNWTAPSGDARYESWRAFLVSVSSRDDARLRGWNERLVHDRYASAVFNRAQAITERLSASCPELRSVVHSDLLHGNVLVADDDRIVAIFDWGCGLAGDPLYDLAWLMFWAPWHPGIDPDRVRRLAADQFDSRSIDDRLACYQLHIALMGMQYQAFAELDADLTATAAHTDHLLATL
jgi:hygromycin-B 4-O-kinase